MAYGDNENNYFVKAEKGIGLNKESKLEGIKQNNFIGTYLIGPILILNPLFTKKLIQMLGVEKPTIAFEKETMDAYEQRLEEFKR
jgi:CobQ-like glutamine amidotransferase family enzyme